MKAKELRKLGVPSQVVESGLKAAGKAMKKGADTEAVFEMIRKLLSDPEEFTKDPLWGKFASELATVLKAQEIYRERDQPAPYSLCSAGLLPDRPG